MPVLVGEALTGGDDARMIVTMGERAETAEEIEDLPAVLVDVIHPLRLLDLHLVKAEQLHEVKLAGIDVILEEVRHRLDVEGLGLFDAQKVGFHRAATGRIQSRRFDRGSVEHFSMAPYSAGWIEAALGAGLPASLARYSL